MESRRALTTMVPRQEVEMLANISMYCSCTCRNHAAGDEGSSASIMSDNHLDSTEAEWLNEAYVRKMLTTYEGKPVTIISYKISKATAKGENYASAMHRIHAEYSVFDLDQPINISLIVKSRIEDDLMAQIADECNIFEREIQVYDNIMVSCEDLLKTIGDETSFGPKALYIDERVIVLEDLKQRGYKILDVKKGLDYEQCRRVLEKVAKFHATTAILFDKNPDIFKHHMKDNISLKEYTPMHDFYKFSVQSCIEHVESIPHFQKYVEKLKEFGKTILETMDSVYKRTLNGFNVLNHGDLWVNNMMFQEDADGNNTDVLLVDYQEGYVGSPGIDLNYFIYTSLQRNVFINRKNDLIKGYHRVLVDTLTKLNYLKDLPTLEDIKKEFFNKIGHGMTTATCIYPALINEHPEYAEPVVFLTDTEEYREKRAIIFNNPNFTSYLEPVLEDFVRQGVL